jgi:MFS superfamily sulfate permease-like transporter
VPGVTAAELWSLLGPAAAIALIGLVEGVAAFRATVDPLERRAVRRREGIALGGASIGSGLVGGFAAMASRSRSVSARGAGAHSQLFQTGSALIVLFVLLTGGPLIARLPLAALAAAVMVVTVPRMVDFPGFVALWRHWRAESLIALVTDLAVASLGVLKGMLIAVMLALGQLVLRAARPHDAVLTVTNPDQPAHEVGERDLAGADVLIYRADAPLFFANIGRIQARVVGLVAAGEGSVRYLILDAESVFYLDATAAETLADLTLDLRERGCRLLLARARPPVLATLRGNPYRDGATQALPAFASVREAHTAATDGTA